MKKINTMKVNVSAYCLTGRTASGARVRPGIVAADPAVLPLGSIVHLRAVDKGAARRAGTYTVLDTGKRIRGRRLDIYMRSCAEAVRFGRRSMFAEVLRIGWKGRSAARQPQARLGERPSGLHWLPWRDAFALPEGARASRMSNAYEAQLDDPGDR